MEASSLSARVRGGGGANLAMMVAAPRPRPRASALGSSAWLAAWSLGGAPTPGRRGARRAQVAAPANSQPGMMIPISTPDGGMMQVGASA